MRIVGGRWRGTGLAALGKGDAAAHLRPTSDKVRESLFNVLEHGGYPALDGLRVLDLFAGTGALALEALSRGAAEALMIDDGAKSGALIRQNIERLQCADIAKLQRRSALKLGGNAGAPYDLIFLDPPYGKGLGERALTAALAGDWLAAEAVIVWEESARITPPERLRIADQRRYGDTEITILRRQ
ncbi:16S rRNA (guanine(966)-N(2))-methyltransferase RsmD [Algicella marina]|uniref:16S rRNA (Guanine(966)-N(2))-methyltransferase RsmD n=1 Tax=Algicella marina TaxID=2683284 RepID=A0A6P1T3Z2_9RHOB|nr:16S rRNA (guanine(966)-N(2))-methyltransferase RsmD [Algicella marina]QHQ36481.1 16S rRNA (guanine(966)-N(2))-methyltransferase RsmD [Algicella marina]